MKIFYLVLSAVTHSTLHVYSEKESVRQLTFCGKQTILKCNRTAYYWNLYKRNEPTLIEIFNGYTVAKKREQTYQLISDSPKNDFFIRNTTFNEAGKYICYEQNMDIISEIIVIVIDESITCDPSPNSTIILRRNYLITINCSFHYEADNSCEATPLWSDFETKESLVTPRNDHSSGFYDNSLWLTLNGDVGNAKNLWLRVVFNCEMDHHHHSWSESLIFDTVIVYKFASSLRILSFTCMLSLLAPLVVAFVLGFALCFWRFRIRQRNFNSQIATEASTAAGDTEPGSSLDAVGDSNYEKIEKNKIQPVIYDSIV